MSDFVSDNLNSSYPHNVCVQLDPDSAFARKVSSSLRETVPDFIRSIVF